MRPPQPRVKVAAAKLATVTTGPKLALAAAWNRLSTQAGGAAGAGNGSVRVSTSVLCLVAAGSLVLLVILATMAYRSGYSAADEKATRELRMAAAPVADPLKVNAAQGTGAPGPQATAPPPRVQQQPSPTAQPPATSGREPRGPGVRAVLVPPEPDPRQAGVNYYAIEGQLDRESAEQIAAFLAENGVAAAAVDTAPRGTNNPRSYRVYGLQGFTSAEYRTPARAQYEQQISRLGQIFKQEHRGWTEFAQTNWERYQP